MVHGTHYGYCTYSTKYANIADNTECMCVIAVYVERGEERELCGFFSPQANYTDRETAAYRRI
jgi:hypothetical protein